MSNCKFCGKPVKCATVHHAAFLEKTAEEMAEKERQTTTRKLCPYCFRGRTAIGEDENGRPICINMREEPAIEGDEWGIKIRFCPMCGRYLEEEDDE